MYTGVYGPSNQRDKHLFFNELGQAKPTMPMPWLIAGYFNVTLNLQERSNTGYPVQQMMRFRSLVNSLGLIDLPLQGRKYTWSNDRDDPTFVRLDRFLMSAE